MYLSLEKAEANLEFWRSMMVVCSSALETLRAERSLGRAAFMDQNRATEAVRGDITALLRNKSLQELRQLQDSVKAKLASGDPIDVEYWEGLLKELAVWMSKAKLKTMHEVVLRNRLEHLRRKQRDEAVRVQSELASAVENAAEEDADALPSTNQEDDAPQIVQEEWEERMQPKLVSRIPMEDQHLQLVDPAEEVEKLVGATFLQFRYKTDFRSTDRRSSHCRACTLCSQEAEECSSRSRWRYRRQSGCSRPSRSCQRSRRGRRSLPSRKRTQDTSVYLAR